MPGGPDWNPRRPVVFLGPWAGIVICWASLITFAPPGRPTFPPNFVPGIGLPVILAGCDHPTVLDTNQSLAVYCEFGPPKCHHRRPVDLAALVVASIVQSAPYRSGAPNAALGDSACVSLPTGPARRSSGLSLPLARCR